MPFGNSPSIAEEGSAAPALLALKPLGIVCKPLPVLGKCTAAAIARLRLCCAPGGLWHARPALFRQIYPAVSAAGPV